MSLGNQMKGSTEEAKFAARNRWRLLVGNDSGDETFFALERAYTAPARHYHTLEHILECLQLLDWWEEISELSSPGVSGGPAATEAVPSSRAVKLALWFHDAVYEPGATDNEAESAAWCLRVAHDLGFDPPTIELAERCILATAHAAFGTGEAAWDAASPETLITDIDLAILGAPRARYDRYAEAVWSEYEPFVPRDRFLAGRASLLRSLLESPSIYGLPAFADRFGFAARANIKRELASIEARW